MAHLILMWSSATAIWILNDDWLRHDIINRSVVDESEKNRNKKCHCSVFQYCSYLEKDGKNYWKRKKIFFLCLTYCCSHKPNVFGRGDLNPTWFGHTSNLNIEKRVLKCVERSLYLQSLGKPILYVLGVVDLLILTWKQETTLRPIKYFPGVAPPLLPPKPLCKHNASKMQTTNLCIDSSRTKSLVKSTAVWKSKSALLTAPDAAVKNDMSYLKKNLQIKKK